MSALYPETFKEICEAVLAETDGRGVRMDSVSLARDTNGDLYLTNPTHRNIVSWVAQFYRKIQLASPLWSFLHKRGKFLSVTANKDMYKKSGIREVDWDSFYFIKSDETTRTPVEFHSYDWWKQEEKSANASTASRPVALIQGPGVDEWILWPTPTAAGALYGEWLEKPHQLENAEDEPCWDSRYNPLLVWGVIRYYAAEFSKEGSAEKLISRANQEFPVLWDAFERDYLPKARGADALF
jgi:hypothetical protein